jgi:hypothetical protein
MDGYAVYDSAVRGREDIIQAGCFAYARRKFFEGQKTGVHAKFAAIGIKYLIPGEPRYCLSAEIKQGMTDSMKNLPL